MAATATTVEAGCYASPLAPLVFREYPRIKSTYSSEGSRRKWLLRVVDAFWQLKAEEIEALASELPSVIPLPDDSDPLDSITVDAPELGILVRSDFSDEAAWDGFCRRLQDAEAELLADMAPSEESAQTDSNAPAGAAGEDTAMDDSDSDESESGTPPRVFAVVNPSSPSERVLVDKISNLTALRLFNDVDIRRAPERPRDMKRAAPHRLVDYNGFQEVYRGKTLWIYDERSNADQCVRVVNSQGDTYGTATGDSWRARVTHICELQVNMASGAIRVDFGGLDRYDHGERQRNLVEAETSFD